MEVNSSYWDQIKSQMKGRNLNNKSLATWLDPIQFVESKVSSDRLRFILGVPNPLHQYYVVENLQDKIIAEISDTYKSPFEVEFVITGQSLPLPPESPQALEEAFNKNNPAGYSLQQQAPYKDTRTQSDPLNAEMSFSTFVVGKNSEFAHAACYNVARNPGADDYNPLFIFGPVGMGKTHLLHAAGNHIRESSPHLRITYISFERFLNECIAAMRHHQMDKFRLKYRDSTDVLLVDDIQYIGKGEATQNEFFHIINTFIDLKKQVIVASDRMPKDILNIEDRNRTRLERGLIADITMPDVETRIAILRYKAEKLGLRISEEVVTYVAKISKRSIRELEGNLKKIKMFSELQGLEINYDLVKRVLAQHETQATISVEEIQRIVTDHFEIKLCDLKSSARAKQIVVPRQIAMYLIKKFLDKSLVDIGKAFGGRDHTTVMNAISRVRFLQSTDQDIFKDIEELATRIHNITGV